MSDDKRIIETAHGKIVLTKKATTKFGDVYEVAENPFEGRGREYAVRDALIGAGWAYAEFTMAGTRGKLRGWVE